MELWVIFTVFAAATQALRTAVQRRMTASLGNLGASYIRFSYAFPIAWLFSYIYSTATGTGLPGLPMAFWFWINLAALTQVIFTILLVQLFSHRSFAAAVAFSKTEVLQTAIFEALILGVIVTVQTGFAIALGVFATVLLSFAKANLALANLRAAIFSRQVAIGLGAGAFLGFCTVCYGAALKTMSGGDVIGNAIFAAAIGTTIQAVCFGAYIYVVSREQLLASFREWRQCFMAGVWAATCSMCWFAGFALHEVAPVRAVGQVELLFSVGFSVLYFKERVSRVELAAMALLAISIIMVLLD
jgi:drug/metabolite transporter (DMT)-like permease